jgi:hypothetical protein
MPHTRARAAKAARSPKAQSENESGTEDQFLYLEPDEGDDIPELDLSFNLEDDQLKGELHSDAGDIDERPSTEHLEQVYPRDKPEEPVSYTDAIPEVEYIEVMLDKHVYKTGLDGSLPPIHELEEIFQDISKKAITNGIQAAIRHLGSRKLRVVTMCSGTESPLLALEMVSKSECRFSHIIKYINCGQVLRNFAARP